MKKLCVFLALFSLVILSGHTFFLSPGYAGLHDGLVSYWKLDEVSGNVIDSVDNNTGVNTELVPNQAGKINKAYVGSGSPQRITIPDADNLTCPSALSLSCWVYHTTQDSQQYILSKWTGTGDIREYSSQVFTDNLVYFSIFTDVAKGVKSTNTLPLNSWVFITSVWNGTDLRIYINGSLNCTPVSATGTITNRSNSLFIFSFSSTAYFFLGLIDEVGIWNRALSASEVSQLYNGGGGLSYPFSNNTLLMFGD